MTPIHQSLQLSQSSGFQTLSQISVTTPKDDYNKKCFEIYKYLFKISSTFKMPKDIVGHISRIFYSFFMPVIPLSRLQIFQDKKTSPLTNLALYEGQQVAVKTLTLGNNFDCETFEKEAKKIFYLQHPNIIKIFGYTIPSQLADKSYTANLVMEEMQGNLYDHLLTSPLRSEDRLSILCGVAQGLFYLHAYGITHQGIKSQNVLLDKNLTPKLKSPGFHKLSHFKKTNMNRWLPPEIFHKGFVFKPSVDIYGFGMIIWQTFAKRNPYSKEQSDTAVLPLIRTCSKEEIPENCPLSWKNLIERCWAISEKRPTSSEIVEELKSSTNYSRLSFE